MPQLRFDPVQMPTHEAVLRREVRDFLARELTEGSFHPKRNSWISPDPAFSRRCAAQGYIGMTWPKRYGGHERTSLERYIVIEELLAGGAPVGSHWIADRQSGPQILRHANEAARQAILPRIAAGECFFSIGMSEPDSGSDLAAVKTRAVQVAGGWEISGSKIWTSGAHQNHYLIRLARNSTDEAQRHGGLTQFIVDLKQPGLTIRPIRNLLGEQGFNQLFFDQVFVPDAMVLGEVGQGWQMVTAELAFERSGPDRFLSDYQLLLEAMRAIGPEPDRRAANEIGRFVAHLAVLRRMSGSIAGMLERGEQPVVEAALVKDLGTTLEREIPETVRVLIDAEPTLGAGESYAELLALGVGHAPSFTLRGGTREVLRGMIARGLGLR